MESLFYIFAALSFLIACMGLFGLSTFMVQQRVREIGIRKVLGAPVTGIVMLLTTDFSKLVLLSAVIAIPIGWFAMQELATNICLPRHHRLVDICYRCGNARGQALLTISVQSVKAAMINPATTLRVE